ncbi:hypothetical protein ABZY14_33350 [Streptomyces sp. NPDC006617]|uniref:galactose-binding domain-containing protein n=1 Tax=Streptomyces sp. NPDC006617 TaxID=3155354 RepID=UPI0033AAEFF7
MDGSPNTYRESTNHSFPQWLQVDLGAAHGIGRTVLALPRRTTVPPVLRPLP